jgi:acyl carrier protein
MTDNSRKLIQCFRSVFPDLPEAQIPAASQDTVPAWDSVASIMLLNVVEEEFGVPMDLERIEEFTSFEAILQHLQRA